MPYVIDSSFPRPQRAHDAIAHWNSRSSVRLVPRTNEGDFVRFVNGPYCLSAIGRQGSLQEIQLAPGCGVGAAIHEIGHAFGLFHEQSRQDRDRYVRILWNNILPDARHNFATYNDLADDSGPYDYDSIMHYGAHDFSANGQPTIESTRPIGQRSALSQGDLSAINELYAGGWSVRICYTVAERIEFHVGLGGNDDSHFKWFDWHAGAPSHFYFPSDVRWAWEIWLKAIAHPEPSQIKMRIFYGGYPAQWMDFDEDEEHEVSQDDRDDSCIC